MQPQLSSLSHRPLVAMPLFDDQQASELARVKAKIDPLVLAFFATKQPGSQFHVNDLIRFVWDREPYATATSPDRVMRELKKGKQLNYELVSRKKSLYRVLVVEAA
jgi:hypothetical protein